MTSAPFNALLTAASAPPVMEARRWVSGKSFPADRPLINLSQAAPVDPPPERLRQRMAEAALHEADAHLYGPVLGLPELREEIAAQWSRAYGDQIEPDQVAITSGCNQAFCAAIASVAGPGDEVILPYPWYFNHKMWLDMAGVKTLPLPCGADGLPDIDKAATLIGPKTCAITLVSPNNPTGAEYPPALLGAFFELAQAKGLALILDETYRDFHSQDGAPHDLFTRAGQAQTLIHLYSFSKTFRLTGHRVGALICGAQRLAQIEKFLDTMTICPAQLGQIAALEGLREMTDWVAGERREILDRRAALMKEANNLGGFTLTSCGAYFAWLEHDFDVGSAEVAMALVDQQSLLLLPGSMFAPAETDAARRGLRLAFANANAAGLAETAARLRAFAL